MTPVHCRVSHNPPHTYGDCIRACVASILNLDPEKVPHFIEDGCDGETVHARIRAWLGERNLAPFWTHFDGSIPLEDILSLVGEQNPTAYYILYGATADGDHVVVCRGGEVVHNPAWYRIPFVGSPSWGCWTILVIGVA